MKYKAIIKWYTSPQELRSIASSMEQKWGRVLPGESNIVGEMKFGNFKVDICYDQSAMNAVWDKERNENTSNG